MKKKVLSVLLALALVLGLFPALTLHIHAEEHTCVDSDGNQRCDTCGYCMGEHNFDPPYYNYDESGHFLEYMLLGFWAMLLAGSYDLRYRAAIAWGGSTLYAVTDELHQLGVEGRAGMFTDVLIDSGGVLAGVLAAMLLVRFLGRIHRKR